MGDLTYNLAEWLRTTQLVELALWIGTTKFNALIVNEFWAIPVIQVVHIIALSMATGSILMVNLKVYNAAGNGVSFEDTRRRFAPWIWYSLLTLLCTGLLMIIAEPVRELINPAFWLKMITLVITSLLILNYLKGLGRNAEGVPASGRGIAIVIVLCWILMIFCGRLIAYTPV
jgi:putative copper export protein